MEFIIVFLVTLLIISFLALAMYFGKPPVYRPSQSDILQLLRGVVDGSTGREEWDMFIGHPLHFDPTLESVRQHCIILEEGDENTKPVTPGLGHYIYGQKGRVQIHELANALEKLMEEAPISREF